MISDNCCYYDIIITDSNIILLYIGHLFDFIVHIISIKLPSIRGEKGFTRLQAAASLTVIAEIES